MVAFRLALGIRAFWFFLFRVEALERYISGLGSDTILCRSRSESARRED
jgi:hypothetical protein